MSQEFNLDTAKAMMSLWTTKQIGKIRENLADNATFTDCSINAIEINKEEYLSFCESWFAGSEDLEIDIKSVAVSPDKSFVMLEWRMRYKYVKDIKFVEKGEKARGQIVSGVGVLKITMNGEGKTERVNCYSNYNTDGNELPYFKQG